MDQLQLVLSMGQGVKLRKIREGGLLTRKVGKEISVEVDDNI